MSSKNEEEYSRASAIEVTSRRKTPIITFFLGIVIGGVITFIITYSATTSTDCDNLSKGNDRFLFILICLIYNTVSK